MYNFTTEKNRAIDGSSRFARNACLTLALISGFGVGAFAQSTATNVVSGVISVPGERDSFFFNVASDGRYYFDALTNTPPLQWSLNGPEGAVVLNRAFTGSDAQSISDPTVFLVAGNYTLTVLSTGGATNGYGFRFVNLADATLLSPGTVVSNALAPANRTDLYQFAAAAGDRYYFHQLTRTGLPDAWWRLMDPYGNQVFSQGLTDVGTAVAPVALSAAGTYTLMVEGYIGDTGNGSYSFNVVPEGNVPPNPFTGTPMNLGDLISGNLAANTTNSFIFTLASPAHVVFDPLTNSPNLNWTLQGPSGVVVSQRGINTSGGIYNFGPFTLPPGSYQLNVQGNVANPYQFRLLDLATALPLTFGTAVTNTLSPAAADVFYRFNASAGAKFYFDSFAVNNLPDAYWRLVDTNNVVLFQRSVGSSPGIFTLNNSGVYTLLIEGYFGDLGVGSNVFSVTPITDGLQALTLGSVVSGAVNTPGQRQQYTFTLGSAARLYFDSLTNSPNLRWSLDGADGNIVNSRSFTSSDSITIGNPLLALPSGSYTLTITAINDLTSAYQFRLFDIASAGPLVTGAQTSGTLNPANSTVAYQFSLASPAKFIYDPVSLSGLPNTYMRLVDGNGNVPITTYLGSVVGPLTLPAGNYTMLIEGYIGDLGSGSFTFNFLPVVDGTQALAIGGVVNGVIASPGQHQQYTFSLGATSRLYFDSLTNNSNLRWSLDGPTGNVVNSRSFTSSDAQSIGNPILALAPGSYTMTVAAVSDNIGGFQFRLFDLASATPLTPGTLVNASLNPANSTTAYQFTLGLPGKFIYDPLSSTGLPNTYVRLLDNNGNVPITTSLPSVTGPLTLPAGTYTLLIEGYIYDGGSGTYSFNLAPVTDGLQSLTVGTPLTGAISSPGQHQQYTFSLGSSARLYFDSLTNNSNLRWSLDGPTGNVVNSRSFTSSDAQSIGNPVLSLVAGSYTLTVAATSDSIGGYQFNLIDLASAAPLTLGTVVSGPLAPANSTLAYKFTLAAPRKVYYDYLSSAGLPNTYIRLLDANGNVPISTSLGNGIGPLTLPAGSYTLLIEGYIYDTGSGTYSFNLSPITDGTQALALGATVSGAVTSPGQQQQYTFTLAAASRLYFDSLTNTSNLHWSLDGPIGNVVNSRSFSSSDAQSIGNPLLLLPPGNFTLTVSANADIVGGYNFRLLDLAAATPLTPGTPVSASSFVANSTDLYRFTAAAGDRFSFQTLGASGIPNAYWRLFDPYNNLIFSQSFNSSVGTNTFTAAGTYTLLIEGYIGDYGAGFYNFNVLPGGNLPPNPFTGTPLAIGTPVLGTLVTNSATASYTFTLAAPDRIFFDALTNVSFTWSLFGPAGVVVNNRSFQSSDSWDIGDASLALPSGNYQLTVTGPAGGFQFSLLDATFAGAMTLGTVVSNTLSPADSTRLYQFTGTAGQQVSFNGQLASGFSYQPSCRLYGPLGNIVMAQYVNNNVDTFTLPQSGTYLMTVEGRIYDAHASGNFAFNLLPVTYPTNALTVGSTISGTISTLGQRQFYTFTLPAAATLYFDALTNADFVWRLDTAWGQVVNWRSFLGSDANDSGDPSLPLPAGTYTLTVAGNSFTVTGDYQFRLLNFASANAFTPGTPISSALTPANSTVLYHFSGTAGQQLYFDGQLSSGFSYQPFCRLYGPLGNILFGQYVNSDVDTFTLPQSGNYTLTVEGRVYDTHGSGNYAFNLFPVTYPTNTLSLNSTVSGTVATLGQRQFYTFTLPAPATLYFDVLTNADFYWRLDAPSGQVINWRSLSSSDANDIGDPSIPLPAGTYTLTVAGNSFAVTGDYQFRLLNLTNAIPFTPGTVVTAALTPANSTTLYQFTGTAGQQFYFNGQPTSGFSYQPYSRLYGPLGNILLSQSVNGNVDTFTLPQSGTYTLTVEGRVYDTHASGNYAFNLIPVTYGTNGLGLGSVVNGAIATLGQRQFYSFTLGAPATLYFDSLTNADFYWRLDAPWGQVVNWRSFSSSDANDIGDPSLPLAAGTYTLTVAGNNFAVAGNYQFRLLNFANATPFTPGTVVSNVLSPADSTVMYRFTGAAGDRFYFDGQLASGFTYIPLCRLYDPAGAIVMSQSVNSDVDTFALPLFGTYTLLVEGRVYDNNASGNYAFNLVPNPQNPSQPLLPTTFLPDLVVVTPAVSPPSGLQSGGSATVQWSDKNNGSGATSGSFTDRVTIRNSATGLILVDTFLPYNESDSGNGPLAPGTSRARQLPFRLPDGPNSVGTLQVTITVDALNSLAESSETNNATSININTTLAPYPDLLVNSVLASPPTRWLPGSTVTIGWQLTNSGTAFAATNWADSVVIRNTNTAVVILNTTTNYNLADAGNGSIAPGEFRSRGLSFTMPTGANAYGVFAVTITADSANQLFEYNVTGNAELNNSTTVNILSAPDLVPTGLAVSANGATQSGATLTINWNDLNSGNVDTGGPFYDRLIVVNGNTTEVLLNTTLYYDPAVNGNGPIAPGTSRARSATFQLPDGLRGVGTIQVSVGLDTFSQIPEFNAAGTGEANNSATVNVNSSIANYPDLQVVNLGVTPAVLNSGTNLTVSWQDTNSGNAIVLGSFYDHVTIVNTNVGVTLLDTAVYYDTNILGPLTNGTSRNRSVNFTLPNGANGAGTLMVTVTADTYNYIFEYNAGGTGELNNATTTIAVSGIAAYPDLQVSGLSVQPAVLGSGTNLTVSWQDTNSGTATTLGSWYDHLTISNSSLGAILLDTTVFYDPNTLGPLTNGTSRLRSYNFTLPYSSNGAGGLVFTVTADTFNNVFEYNPGGTGENNNTASITRSSSLTPLPDLIISSLTATNLAFTSQIIGAQLQLANQGLLGANADMVQRVFLSSTPLAGTGTLQAQADYNGPLAVGDFLDQSVTLLTPATPGTYWLIAQADANNSVVELSEDNNYYVSPTPLNVQPAYTATIVADVHAALANTPIPMHGTAVFGGSGSPAPFVPVTIHIQVRGTDRTFTVLTGANGTFTNVFNPLPNEAGVYQLAAALPSVASPPSQDNFVLIGMSIATVGLVDMIDGNRVTNTVRIDNLSDVPLTSLSVAVITNQPSLAVNVSLNTNLLAAFATAYLTFTIDALNASILQSPVIIQVSSAEGATATLAFPVRVEALTPNLVATPSSLQTTMQRGAQTPVSFTINNQGGASTGPLQIVLPNYSWLSAASSAQLPPLAPGSNTVVTLLLTPPASLALGNYNGSLVIQSTNVALAEPFSFRAISSGVGNMLVTAQDEYTFFASGSPPVTNAQVVLSDALTGVPVVTNFTGLDGTASFTNMTEAFYILDVSAAGHGSFRQTALVTAGTTTNIDAFLTRQTVTYDFTVTPTTVVDSYIFTINSTFETQVPVPVVTIDPASLDLAQYPGTEIQVMYTVANHGLIDAESVTLNFPNTAALQFTALVTNLGKVPANSSFTVPVLIKRITPGVSGPQKNDYLTGQCSVTAQMLWNYLCGPNVVDKSTAAYVFDSTGCNLVDLYRQVYDLVPDNPNSGGGITGQNFFDYLNSLNPVTDFEAPPGYHFQCKTAPPAIKPLGVLGYHKDGGGTSVCAKVQIRLDQKGVITRDAFKATLEINNDTSNVLQNVQATIQISDLTGNVVSTNFAISPADLSNLTAIDGTGQLGGNLLGSATWTLIPTLDAAPTNGVTVYLVGGTLSYSQSGTVVSVPLAAAPIQVFPQPELLVRYFHDRNVYADDPFTPQIEPSIPYSLAVQVNNVGYGPAQSLNITSGKPQIVDNVKGLLINFNILGTQLENQQVSPALSVDFGRIDPGTNAAARWLFSSSLQGSFTNFSASFSEVDQFGKPRLSLIRSVEIHELSHIVDAGGAFEDGRPDFLVNDVSDPDFLPDTLYLSSGAIVSVSAVTNANVNGILSSSNLSITVSATVPAGWSYLRFGDPGPTSQFQLAHVYRADNSEVPFGTNAWATDRIFHGSDVVPTHTNQVHLLDYNSSGTYTLAYTPIVTNVVDTIAPTSSVTALPGSSRPNFTVQWSGTDNVGGSGIALFNIYVSTNAGPFGIWISNTALQGAVFNGLANNNYAFYSRATDIAGNQEAAHASADTQTTTTTPANSPPVISAIPQQTVTEGALFSFTPTATDPDLPAETFTWSLLPGAPVGVLFASSSGSIAWQTTSGDGGTTNPFTLVVTDNGSPSLSATQSFNVVVNRLNHPPSIVALPTQVNVDQLATLSLQLTATDPDLPQQTLTWQLVPGAPSGVVLNPATGLLTWTPTIPQGPSTNLITVSVRDNGAPPLSDTRSFAAIVNAVNHPPVLSPINNQIAFALLPLSVTNSATDPDIPAQTLTFSLDPGAPPGASIVATNGIFTWTPTRAESPSTNQITLRVTDNGLPALSSTRTFTITVPGYLEATLGSTAIQSGQTGTVALTIDATAPITNVNFTLALGAPGLTNLTFTQPSSVLASATLQPIGGGQYLATLGAVPGQPLLGPQTLASLSFTGLSAAQSAFIPLHIVSLSANQPSGVPLARTLRDDGRVELINNIPLLEPLGTGSQFQLRLFAAPGASYTIQATSTLRPPVVWSPIWNGSIDASLSTVIPLPITNASSYFRAKTP